MELAADNGRGARRRGGSSVPQPPLIPLVPHLPYRRMGQWVVVGLGAILAWTLMVLAAVWQGPFLVLFFPAGWCLHAALRQYRELRGAPGGPDH